MSQQPVVVMQLSVCVVSYAYPCVERSIERHCALVMCSSSLQTRLMFQNVNLKSFIILFSLYILINVDYLWEYLELWRPKTDVSCLLLSCVLKVYKDELYVQASGVQARAWRDAVPQSLAPTCLNTTAWRFLVCLVRLGCV